MKPTYATSWARALLALLAMGLLATCSSDSPTETPGRSGSVSADVSGLLATGDSFRLTFDKMVVVVREAGQQPALVTRTFTGSDLSARPLTLVVTVPLGADAEDIAVGHTVTRSVASRTR